MEMRKCDVCGEEYSSTYRSCPFCEEREAIERGKPIHRHSSDFRNRRGGHALGVLALVLALVVIGAGTVYLFGDNIAQALGIREPTNVEDAADYGEDDPANAASDPNSGEDTSPEDGVMPSADDGQDAEAPDDSGTEEPVTPPSTPVALNSEDFTLDPANGGLQYTLQASGGSGTYTWTSADPSVATVSEGGTVTGVGNGTTEVTVSDGFTTAVCIVRIRGITASTTTPTTPSSSAGLSLNREDMTMPAGTTFQLEVSGTSSPVTWSIADTSIATIDADGTVHFLARGTTTATATVDGQTLQCIVRVR